MSIEKGKHFPIFLILTEGRTPIISRIIKEVTHSPFSHASISFDPSLRDIYSFNFGKNNNGFIKENIFTLGKRTNNNIAVFCFFVNKNTKRKIMSSFYDFQKNKEKTRYDLIRLIERLFNKGKERVKYSQVCSSFVAAVLKGAGINIAPSEIYLISPADIHMSTQENKTIYSLYYGPAYNFDAVKVKKEINNLYNKKKTKTFVNIYDESLKDVKDFVENIRLNAEYNEYKNIQKSRNKPYFSKEEFKKFKKQRKTFQNNVINAVKNRLDYGDDITKEDLLKNVVVVKPKDIKKLDESISPEMVDRSKYTNFILFDLFNIYTTDEDLQTNEIFIKKMRWVKNKLENLAKECNAELEPFEITLCRTFEDLDEFYNHKAPKWVTGFTYGNKIYMKSPSLYKGELYYNIVLHESIHAFLFNAFKTRGYKISVKDEEGMAVFFSTPLNYWLKELNHGPNFFYYESAIDVQEDYIDGGMDKVIMKRFKLNDGGE